MERTGHGWLAGRKEPGRRGRGAAAAGRQPGAARANVATDGDGRRNAGDGAGGGVSGNGANANGGAGADGGVAKARADYEVALKKSGARIAELESEIAQTAKSVESAEKLRAEMDELKRAGEEQRIGFELQIAGSRNVKAAKALLSNYDNDIEKLKAAERWLFGVGVGPQAAAGATGLPNTGAASDEGAQMRRWRKIVGIEDDKE